jgi:hypothetical protein
MRMVVLLPAPLGPRNPKISPVHGQVERSTATKSPNRRVRRLPQRNRRSIRRDPVGQPFPGFSGGRKRTVPLGCRNRVDENIFETGGESADFLDRRLRFFFRMFALLAWWVRGRAYDVEAVAEQIHADGIGQSRRRADGLPGLFTGTARMLMGMDRRNRFGAALCQ